MLTRRVRRGPPWPSPPRGCSQRTTEAACAPALRGHHQGALCPQPPGAPARRQLPDSHPERPRGGHLQVRGLGWGRVSWSCWSAVGARDCSRPSCLALPARSCPLRGGTFSPSNELLSLRLCLVRRPHLAVLRVTCGGVQGTETELALCRAHTCPIASSFRPSESHSSLPRTLKGHGLRAGDPSLIRHNLVPRAPLGATLEHRTGSNP